MYLVLFESDTLTFVNPTLSYIRPKGVKYLVDPTAQSYRGRHL